MMRNQGDFVALIMIIKSLVEHKKWIFRDICIYYVGVSISIFFQLSKKL